MATARAEIENYLASYDETALVRTTSILVVICVAVVGSHGIGVPGLCISVYVALAYLGLVLCIHCACCQ